MRLLLDQDVYALTARFLADRGHDVVTAAERGLHEAEDRRLLEAARLENRILVTRDRDYGALVFLEAVGTGVLYLRGLPSVITAIHAQLERVLEIHSQAELTDAFVVVEPGGFRFRRR
ncbi:MAG TPA: DUF5615 family PIN-like protein [Thermoanaerobaculia bacterium]|nr:DUF5615 family PIN-like protein [Thermoanaerobaculia bacterium]